MSLDGQVLNFTENETGIAVFGPYFTEFETRISHILRLGENCFTIFETA